MRVDPSAALAPPAGRRRGGGGGGRRRAPPGAAGVVVVVVVVAARGARVVGRLERHGRRRGGPARGRRGRGRPLRSGVARPRRGEVLQARSDRRRNVLGHPARHGLVMRAVAAIARRHVRAHRRRIVRDRELLGDDARERVEDVARQARRKAIAHDLERNIRERAAVLRGVDEAEDRVDDGIAHLAEPRRDRDHPVGHADRDVERPAAVEDGLRRAERRRDARADARDHAHDALRDREVGVADGTHGLAHLLDAVDDVGRDLLGVRHVPRGLTFDVVRVLAGVRDDLLDDVRRLLDASEYSPEVEARRAERVLAGSPGARRRRRMVAPLEDRDRVALGARRRRRELGGGAARDELRGFLAAGEERIAADERGLSARRAVVEAPPHRDLRRRLRVDVARAHARQRGDQRIERARDRRLRLTERTELLDGVRWIVGRRGDRRERAPHVIERHPGRRVAGPEVSHHLLGERLDLHGDGVALGTLAPAVRDARDVRGRRHRRALAFDRDDVKERPGRQRPVDAVGLEMRLSREIGEARRVPRELEIVRRLPRRLELPMRPDGVEQRARGRVDLHRHG